MLLSFRKNNNNQKEQRRSKDYNFLQRYSYIIISLLLLGSLVFFLIHSFIFLIKSFNYSFKSTDNIQKTQFNINQVERIKHKLE